MGSKARYVIGSDLADGTFDYDRNGYSSTHKAPMITAARACARSQSAKLAGVTSYSVVKLGKGWMDDQTVFTAKVKPSKKEG